MNSGRIVNLLVWLSPSFTSAYPTSVSFPLPLLPHPLLSHPLLPSLPVSRLSFFHFPVSPLRVMHYRSLLEAQQRADSNFHLGTYSPMKGETTNVTTEETSRNKRLLEQVRRELSLEGIDACQVDSGQRNTTAKSKNVPLQPGSKQSLLRDIYMGGTSWAATRWRAHPPHCWAGTEDWHGTEQGGQGGCDQIQVWGMLDSIRNQHTTR